MSRLISILVAVVVVLMLASSSMFAVDQHRYAVVYAMGELREVIAAPGLHFKLPFGIDRAELADADGQLRVKVGDEVEATVVSTGDEIRLSHKLRQGAQAREALAVAAQTGVPVNTVKTRLARGRRALAGLLDEEYDHA